MKVSDENQPTLDQPRGTLPRSNLPGSNPKQTSLPKQEHGGVLHEGPFSNIERIPQVLPEQPAAETVLKKEPLKPFKDRRINPDPNAY